MNNLIKNIETSLTDILIDISTTYNLDQNELLKKYLNLTKDIKKKEPKPKKIKDNIDPNIIVEKKKRGRKKKEKDEIIKTYEYEYNEIKYLVDDNNNVYSYDIDNPCFIGEKLIDGTIKFKELSYS